MPNSESPKSNTEQAASVAVAAITGVSTGSLLQRLATGFILAVLIVILSIVALVYFTKDIVGNYIQEQNRREERRELQDIENRRVALTSNAQFENVASIVRETDQELKKMKATLKASRVIIATFLQNRGNTDQYVFMNARQWEPVDAIDGGIRGIRNQHLSLFPLMVTQFQQKKCLTIPKATPTEPAHTFWLSRGTASVIACPIRNFNSSVFGALLVEYDAPFDEAEGYFLESHVNQSAFNLGGVLFSQDAIQNAR